MCENAIVCHSTTSTILKCKYYLATGRLFSSVAQSCPTLWDPHGLQHTRLPCPSPTPGVYSTHVHRVSDAIQPSHPLSSPSPPSNLPSIRVFSSWVSSLHQVANVFWSFSISPSNVYAGLISFRIDWLDLLAVQGTLKSLLQHHSSKPSILQCSALFIVQLSHPHPTTGKTIALTRQNFVGKLMSLLFNMLSRLVIAFLPRSKPLLIFMAAVTICILEPKKIKSVTVSIVSPSICHEVMGPEAMIFVFWMLSFKQLFHSPLSLSLRDSLVLLRFLP